VIEECEKDKKGKIRWLCQCDCGNKTVVSATLLIREKTRSCGCLTIEAVIKRNTTHGLRYSKIHSVWNDIKNRCNNKKGKDYMCYGGRGIRVCNEWNNNFKAFYDWAYESGYKEGLTIDRINTDGNYSPDNCRWATMKEQSNNRRNNIFVSINGVKVSFVELLNAFGVPRSSGYYRYYNGLFPIPSNKLNNAHMREE
jgi:hypothetical protein